MDGFEEIIRSVMDGDERQAVTLVETLLDRGYHPLEILEQGLIPAMDRLGELLIREEKYVPQILMSAKAMQNSVAVLQPLLADKWAGTIPHDTVVVGTVQGDIHTIGKDLGGIMLRSSGFQVVDLGVDVRLEDFSEAIRRHDAKAAALSAMLTTSMNAMRKIVRGLRAEFGEEFCIIVGGAPITPIFAREIGAQYSENFLRTVKISLDAVKNS